MIDVAQPRTLRGPRGASFKAWVEVSALVGVLVPEWGHRGEAWIRRAVPVEEGVARTDRSVPFSPGRYSGTRGEPPPQRQERAFALTPGEAESIASAVIADSRPVLFRHSELGAVSDVGETAAVFRRRLLAAAAPLVRSGALQGSESAALLSRFADGIESRPLEEEDVVVKRVTVGVVWYPAGSAPAVEAADLMTVGHSRAWR